MIAVFKDASGATQSMPTEGWSCPMCIFANGFVETGFINYHVCAKPVDIRKSQGWFQQHGASLRLMQGEAEKAAVKKGVGCAA